MNRYKYIDENGQHLHTLGGKPLFGTSSITGVLNKPGLVWWSSGKALELLGWTPTKTPKKKRLEQVQGFVYGDGYRIFDEDNPDKDEKWLELLDKCYRNHKDSLDKSADKGIDLHAELERFIKDTMSEKQMGVYNDRITPFIEWSAKNVKRFLWSEAYCYSERLWTGGICDAGALMNDGTIALIDFKSSREAYLAHFLQCAGYSLALEESGILDKDGNDVEGIDLIDWQNNPITKYIIFPFGAKELTPWENKLPIEEYKKGFESATDLYKLMSLEKKED
jgi:hypothetical protein